MRTKLELYSTANGWELQKLYNTADFSERLDEELDTGNVQTITSSAEPFEDCCMAHLIVQDSLGEIIEGYFCGFDTVEKRGGGYFIHSLDLCEPTRLLMGIFIDGRRITQPLEETQKKSLYTVATELLETCETLSSDETPRFALDEDCEAVALMKDIISPEFYWDAGTSLWECLCDIGNVINCIPRLIVNEDKTAFSVITFDKVNEITQTIVD